jgi:hypothetical protein
MAKENALRDGYSCVGKRPRSAAPGVLMDEAAADRFDEASDSMAKWGGRDALLHRRFQDKPQNSVNLKHDDDDPGF